MFAFQNLDEQAVHVYAGSSYIMLDRLYYLRRDINNYRRNKFCKRNKGSQFQTQKRTMQITIKIG